PWQTMIYWGDFHFMHLFGLWALIKTFCVVHQSGSMGGALDTQVLLLWCLFAAFFVKYFLPVLKIQPFSDILLWCWIRYRSNLAMFWGGLKGFGKFKRLYIELSW
ncbi:MAG TPA: hypothetical protein VIJ93_08890, partial [bacterium]